MKLIFLVAGGRAGSDFFQGFLDGHSQILQFPGLLNKKILEIFNENKSEVIAKKFMSIYPYFFNSKLSVRERHNRLGKNKRKYYKVSKKKFLINFVFLMKGKISNYQIIENLHYAYAYASNQKKIREKLIFTSYTSLSIYKNINEEVKL